MSLNVLPRLIQSTLLGRQIFLSYPKSGRTWIVNLFANYWVRLYDNAEHPLPFISRVREPKLQKIWKSTGLVFSHGDKVSRILEHHKLAINRTNLRFSKVTFLVRNPVSLLISFYHHLNVRGNMPEGDLSTFALGPRGYQALVNYYNQVVPVLSLNRRAQFVSYEDLHVSTSGNLEKLEELISFHIGPIEPAAFRWAVKACEFQELKARAAAIGHKRVRKGAIQPEDSELRDGLKKEILSRFYTGLDHEVRSSICDRIPWDRWERVVFENNGSDNCRSS